MAHGEQDLTGWEGEVESARVRERGMGYKQGVEGGQAAGTSQSSVRPKSLAGGYGIGVEPGAG